MFLSETQANFLKDFTIFEEVRNEATGPNFDGLFLGSGGGFVHKARLFFDVGFDLIELLVVVLMFG